MVVQQLFRLGCTPVDIELQKVRGKIAVKKDLKLKARKNCTHLQSRFLCDELQVRLCALERAVTSIVRLLHRLKTLLADDVFSSIASGSRGVDSAFDIGSDVGSRRDCSV
jgi:hypothetical protein